MKNCFIVMAIGEEGSETRKRADKVCKYIIDPVCKECGFEAIRVDLINRSDIINQTIIDHLLKDELVIADMTEHNPNAFYEMGYRACTGKPMINLREKSETIPFDISNIRAFDYDLKDLDSVEEIKTRIKSTINAINFDDNGTETIDRNEGTAKFSDISQVMQLLYNIQDSIMLVKEEIHNKDTETIQTIVKASQSTPPPDDVNTAMMKIVLPELLRNPESLKNLMELGNAINNKKLPDSK